jgi:predicted  nucleic acid-binding Zn-ribbon protein
MSTRDDHPTPHSRTAPDPSPSALALPSTASQIDLLRQLAACDAELARLAAERRAIDAEILPLTARLVRVDAELAYDCTLLSRTLAALAEPAAEAEPAPQRRLAALRACATDPARLGEVARALGQEKLAATAEANRRAALRRQATRVRRRLAAGRHEARRLSGRITARRAEQADACAELLQRAAATRARRRELMARLDAELLARYQSTSATPRLGSAVGGVCSRCHLPVARAEPGAAGPRLTRCPGCGQLLALAAEA